MEKQSANRPQLTPSESTGAVSGKGNERSGMEPGESAFAGAGQGTPPYDGLSGNTPIPAILSPVSRTGRDLGQSFFEVMGGDPSFAASDSPSASHVNNREETETPPGEEVQDIGREAGEVSSQGARASASESKRDTGKKDDVASIDNTAREDFAYSVFDRISREFEGLEEALAQDAVELLPIPQEQSAVIRHINNAASSVASRYGVSAQIDESNIFYWRITSPSIDESLGSFLDSETDSIFIRDRGVTDTDGAIIPGQFNTEYAHEVGHECGLVHHIPVEMPGQESKARGFYISSSLDDPDGGRGYQVMGWIEEAANGYFIAEIKHEAGLTDSPEPTPADFGRADHRDRFDALTANLSRYLNTRPQEQEAFLAQLAEQGVPLTEITPDTMKQVFVYGRLQRPIYDAAVGLMRTAYSQKESDAPPFDGQPRYTSVWDEMLDDLGWFEPYIAPYKLTLE